jgi:glyoxylase-like metal-dependent hydrolase (beta-lactamase superfamily II)
MEIKIINTGLFKLDGGAMYGVVPKKLWSKLNSPDENNLCTWAMRCLLVKEGNRVILFDTGMGDKQDERFRSHFQPHNTIGLVGSLESAGVAVEEVTDVFLTHLHFDHCGGALERSSKGDIVPVFPNATYWTNEVHLESALKPNFREKASFLKENIVPLMEHKVLKYLDVQDGIHFSENITVDFYNGHTTAMMVPTIKAGNKHIVFAADLLPSIGHVRMPYVMSYDIRPLETLKEKSAFYEKILNDQTYVMFEHDKDHAFGQLERDEKGRYGMRACESTQVLGTS